MVATITLKSQAFQPGGTIPRRYTKDGRNISPPLQWDGVPPEAQELALIVEDPDAPGAEPFAHWLVYHIPPKIGGLPEGTPEASGPVLQPGVEQGRTRSEPRDMAGPRRPAVRAITITSNFSRWMRRLTSSRGRTETRCSRPPRATSWPRANWSGCTGARRREEGETA